MGDAPPEAEFDVVPALLALDLSAAVAACAVSLWALRKGSRTGAAVALGLAAPFLLADALVGHPAAAALPQVLGLAAPTLLVGLLAYAARVPRRGLVWLACAAAALVTVAFDDPFLDLACARSCVSSPVSIAHVPELVDAARVIALVTTVGVCTAAARVRPAGAVAGVALAAARLGVLTDDPLNPVQRLLHAAAAAGTLLVAASIAAELTRMARARERLGVLVRELRPSSTQGLEQALREASGADALRIVYRHPDRQVLVDAGGAAVPDAGAAGAEGIQVRRGAAALATLIHAPPDIAGALGPVAALMLDNERLAAAHRYDLAILQDLSARLVAIDDAERSRIERNLHDGAQQRLVAAILALKLLELQQPALAVDEALTGLEQVTAEVRAVAHGIHPQVLFGAGLGPALQTLAVETGGSVEVDVDGLERLPAAIEVTVYAAAQELIAPGRLTRVVASRADGWLQATVATRARPEPTRFEALGDRARALGGALTVSGAVRLDLRLPLLPSMPAA